MRWPRLEWCGWASSCRVSSTLVMWLFSDVDRRRIRCLIWLAPKKAKSRLDGFADPVHFRDLVVGTSGAEDVSANPTSAGRETHDFRT